MAAVLNQRFIFVRVDPMGALFPKKDRKIALQSMDFTTMLFFTAQNPQAAKGVRYNFSAQGISLSEIFNEHGFSPLHVAAFKGNTNFINMWCQSLKGPVDIKSKKEQLSPLHLAAQEEQLEAIDALHSFHCNLDAQDIIGRCSIFTAIHHKRYKAIELLAKLGADLNLATVPEGITALHFAANVGDIVAIGTLLQFNAQVNAVSLVGEFTPLDSAACNGHQLAIRILVRNGAEVNRADSTGVTPLHLTVDNQQIDATCELVERGADLHKKDKLGNSVLHVAARKDSKEMIAALMTLHARASAKKPQKSMGTESVTLPDFVNNQNEQGVTPLHVAAYWGNLQSCAELLARGAQRSTYAKTGDIPLAYAAQNDHVQVVKLLASPDTVNVANAQGLTAVHIATQNDRALVLLALRSHNPDLEKQDGHGNTPIHIAAYLGRLKALKTLKNLGANPNSFNRDGDTPLNLAAQKGHKDIVDYLLSLKDIAFIDSNGRNPLHFAIEGKVQDCDLFISLLKAGIDPALADPTTKISPLEMNYPPLQAALAKIAT